jgi:D-glycerate 3-kinase
MELFIQEELRILTNIKFSKKYISQYIIPIINNIYHSKNNKYILSGSQGSGKSTLAKLLKLVIEKYYKKKVMLLSIDDYYLSKNQRLKLSKKIHPLLLTRGVPGTHDIKALKYHISQFKNQNFPINTPTFNKLKDEISKKRKVINNAEILLLEGWCCGSIPIANQYLFKNINSLENIFDKNKNWRKYYNFLLRNEYQSVFSMFDKKIYIQAPSFKYILKWRYSQEKGNASKSNNKNFLNKAKLQVFIQHYEKLTKWMMLTMPTKADILIKIDSNQKIKKLLFKSL